MHPLSFLSHPSVLATAVTPGWNVWTVLGAVVLLGLAGWFVVIARDLGDGFARFSSRARETDAETAGRTTRRAGPDNRREAA